LNHFASPDFWAFFDSLPRPIQRLARRNFRLLVANPRHPSLQMKKAAGYWTVRVGRNYRAVGKAVEGGVLWGWIGSHAEYDHLLGR
jgi:hypothetical protein